MATMAQHNNNKNNIAVPKDPLKADFRNFLFVLWSHLGLGAPTRVQYDIAQFLQHGGRRRIIEAFRGVGKSWITAAYVLWLLYCDPEERILVVSASKDRADSFSVFVKRLINEVPILKPLKSKDGQRDSNVAFDVGTSSPHQAPSVRSVGINGQLTGGRATRIIADDVEVPKNSLTQMQRQKLAESVKEFDAVLVPSGEITYLGTPQTEESLYNELCRRGYTARIWPARYPSAKLQEAHGDKLAPYIREELSKNPSLATSCFGRGEPIEPSRFHDLDLLEREASYGRSGFSMQFMLDTSFSDIDKYPLKLSDFIVFNCDNEVAPIKLSWATGVNQVYNDLPCVGMGQDRWHRPLFISQEFKPYQGIVMAIDPSGSGSDELSYAVIGMLNGYLYLLDCQGLQGGYADDNLEKLAKIAKQYKVNEILVEKNFGDGMFTKLLTPFLVRIHPCTTTEVSHSTQKERRIIDTLEPVLNQHRLVVNESLIRRDQENYNQYSSDVSHNYQLFYQMSRITKDRGSLRKDDRIDSLAMAVTYWVETMDKDTQTILNEARETALDEALELFQTQVFGMSPTSLSWVN